MPLPEVQTLQNSDAVAAQQNPAFMQENHNQQAVSPEPQVAAPAPTPVQDPQYAPQKANNSPYDQDFLQKVYGAKPDSVTPGNLPTYAKSDVAQPRYPQFMPGGDNEEVYGLNQPWYKKLGNDLLKTGALAVGTFAQGLMTLPDIVSAVKNHNMSDLYDSPIERSAASWTDKFENQFPNYATRAQQQMNPFLQAIPGLGNASNFWFDKVLKNAGFMVGAIGSAVVQDTAVGALTSGLGDIPLVAAQFGKASLWMNKVLTGTDKAEEFLQAVKQMGGTGDQLINIKNLANVAAGKKLIDNTKYMMNLYGSGRTMSAGGAREVHDSMISELTNKYVQDHGYQPIGEDLKKITDTAEGAANAKFGIDTTLMMIGESISFDNMLRPYKSAQNKYISEAQRSLGTDIGNVGIKKGTLDQIEYQPPTSLAGKAWTKFKPSIPHILNAGPILGGGMFATNAAVHDFWEAKYDGKIKGTLDDMINSTVKGLGDEFGTHEGLESVVVGGVLGALVGPITKRIELKYRGTTPQLERDMAIAKVNQYTVSGLIDHNYGSAAKTIDIQNRMNESLKKGDIFSYENLKHQQFYDYVTNHMKNKMFDVGLEKLRLMKDLPDEQFKTMWGMDPNDETRRSSNSYVDEMIKNAKDIKKSMEMIDSTFKNPFEYRQKKSLTDAEKEENTKSLIFDNIKYNLGYYSAVGRNAADRLGSIEKNVKTINPLVDSDMLSRMTSKEKLSQYNDTLKAEARDLQKNIDSDTTVTPRPEDKQRIAWLNSLTSKVDIALADAKNPHQVFDDSNKKTLESVLNLAVNGGDFNGKLRVAPESITDLANYGTDINKLQFLQEQARDAYDQLGSKKGFNDFYNAENARRNNATYQEEAKQKQQAAGTPVGPNDIVVKNPITKQDHTFTKGESIFVPQKGGNDREATLLAQNADGSLTVEYPSQVEGEPGVQEVLTPEQLFTEQKETTDISKGSPASDVPPEGPEVDNSQKDQTSDPQRDIKIHFTSTSDPEYEKPRDGDVGDDNYHRRHQKMLYDMGSSDPKVFNQKNRAGLRILPVTTRTEEYFGFKKGWIKDTGGDDTSIRAVYVIHEPQVGTFFTDGKGEKMGKVVGRETPVDSKQAIYTVLRTAETGDKYTNKTGVNEKEYSDWWESQRQQILGANLPKMYEFTVSRGLPITTEGARNSPIKVGLIRAEDLSKSIITITTSADVVVNPAVNEQGVGIGPTLQAVNFSNKKGTNLGKYLLNHGNSLTWLNNRPFTSNEAETLHGILKYDADKTVKPQDKQPVTRYVNGMIYRIGGDSSRPPTENSISIKGNFLYLGKDTKGIKYTPAALEAEKARITTFLEGVFHHVSQNELLRIKDSPKDSAGLKYVEYEIKEGKPSIKKTWDNYNQYLLSDTGRDPVLSTNIAIPEDGAPPIIQKYSTLKGVDFQKPAPKPAEPVKKAEPAKDLKQAAIDSLESRRQKELAKAEEVWRGNVDERGFPKESLQPIQARINARYDQELATLKALGAAPSKTPEAPVKVPEAPKAPEPAKPAAIQFEKINPAEVKPSGKKVEFTRKLNDGTTEKVKGYKINIPSHPDTDFYVSDNEGTTNWMVTDGKSGGTVAPSEATRKEAIAGAIKRLNEISQSDQYDREKIAKLGLKQKKVEPVVEKGPVVVNPPAPTSTVNVAKFIEQPTSSGQPSMFIHFMPETDAQGRTTGVKEYMGYTMGTPKGELIEPSDKGKAGQIAIINREIAKNSIKADDSTNGTKDMKLGNPNITAGPESQTRYTNILPNDYQVQDLAKESAEVQRMLPGIKINELDHVIKTTGGGLAWGMFQDSAIHIWKEAEVGTLYHEAFEAVWNTHLDGRQQADLYYEFQNRAGQFETFDGRTIDFADASLKEAKEKIAEEFRDYKLDPKRALPPKQRNWFQRLIHFIKTFFLGDRNSANEVFDRINRSQYKDNAVYSRNVVKEPQYRDIPESMAFQQDTVQGMTERVLSDLFGDNKEMLDQLENNPKQASKDLFARLYKDLNEYYTSTESGDYLYAIHNDKYNAAKSEQEKAEINSQLRSKVQAWEKIKASWPQYVDALKKSLRVFDIKFKVDEDGNVDFDPNTELEQENKNMNDFDNDVFKRDAKSSASTRTNLMYLVADSRFLKNAISESYTEVAGPPKIVSNRDNSQVGLAKLAPRASLFNYALHNSANLNSIYQIYDKLKTTAGDVTRKINANLQRVLNRVDFSQGYKDKPLSEMRAINSYENTHVKQQPKFFRQYVGKDGLTHFYTNVENGKSKEIKKGWVGAMKNSELVKAGSDKFLSFKKNIDFKEDNVSFLNKLGINIDKADYDRLPAGVKNDFDNHVTNIKAAIKDAANKNTKVSTVDGKSFDFDTRLDKLADLYSIHITGDDTQSQHMNLDGEQTANFVTNNSASKVLNDANSSSNIAAFLKSQPHFQDIFHRDSVVMNRLMFKPDGEHGRNVFIGVVEGRQHDNEGNHIPTNKLTGTQRSLYEVNNNLNGVFYVLVPADAKTEWAMHIGHFVDPTEFFKGDKKAAFSTWGKDMHNYLQTEIALAKDFSSNEARFNVIELNKELPSGRQKGDSLRFFLDILPKETVDRIHSEVIDRDAPLDSVITETELNNHLAAWIGDKANKSFDQFEKGRIFSMRKKAGDETVAEYALAGVDAEFLERNLGKKRTYTREEAVNMLAFREMNYVQGGIEMHKLVVGDPAVYKDEIKRIKSFLSSTEHTHVDTLEDTDKADQGYNNRADIVMNNAHGRDDLALQPSDFGYTVHKNYANTITLHDIEVTSREAAELKAVLGERANPYLDGRINEADAQVWHFPTHYREILYKNGGRFTQKQEDAFQWHMAYERVEEAKNGKYEYTNDALKSADEALLKENPLPDPTVTFPILKLKSSGIQYVDGTAIPTIDKASWAPMFYHWTEGYPNAQEAYRTMRTKGIDYMRVESAHKVGIQGDSFTELYNADGEINTEGIMGTKLEQIPHSTLGIQVEQGGIKDGTTEGSQLRKIATLDLRSNKVPIDYIDRFKGNEAAARQAWDKLSPTDRLKESPIERLIKKHETHLDDLTEKRYQDALKKLNIKEDKDGLATFADKKKVSQFIRDEITRRELPLNAAAGLEIDPATGDFYLPLEANVRYQELRQILYSVVDKTIVRAKVSGGQKTMLTNTLWEKSNRVFETSVNGKKTMVSNDLNFYKLDKDGKTTGCEVYLPYWFGEKVRSRLMLTNKFKSEREFHDHLLNYLNRTKEGKELLSGIGFRIPTQGTNSVDHFIVKDFLPAQMGDTIVLPSEITAKAGSDFDIDKLNTYLKNFYVDKQGYPHPMKFENIDSNDEQALKDYYERNILEDYKDYKKALADYELKSGSGDFLRSASEKIFGNAVDESTDAAPERVPTLDEFITENKGKPAEHFNSVGALENRYFDTLKELLALPEKFKSLVTPNDATALKNVSKEIQKLQDPNWVDEDKQYKPGNLIDSQFMAEERDLMMQAKGMIGTSAVSQTVHSLAQASGILLKHDQKVAGDTTKMGADLRVRMPHNEVNGFVSISGMNTTDTDQLISNVNSQVTDGSVDAAKDKWLLKMGVNQNTVGNFLLPIRWGTDAYRVALFNNQPAVKEFLRLTDIYKSVPSINKFVRFKNSYQIFSEVTKFNRGAIQDGFKGKVSKPKEYSISAMETMIQKVGRGEKLTQGEKLMQAQILDDYMIYDKAKWNVFNLYQGTNWDTARMGDPNMISAKNIKFQNAMRLPLIGQEDLMKNTFVGRMRDRINSMSSALKTLLPVQSDEAGNLIHGYIDTFTKQRGMDQESLRKSALNVELTIINHATQLKGLSQGTPLNVAAQRVMLGDMSAANQIIALKKSGIKDLVDNPFIQNIRPVVDPIPGMPHTLEMIKKDYDTYTSNILTDAMRELRDDGRIVKIAGVDRKVSDIYQDVLAASMIQTGMKRTATSFGHIIPNEDYADKVKSSLTTMAEADADNFRDNYVPYRTNWLDDKIVPKAPKTQQSYDVHTGLPTYVYPFAGGAVKTALGGKEAPGVLKLDSFQFADKAAVKINEPLYAVNDADAVEKNIIVGYETRLFRRVEADGEPFVIEYTTAGELGDEKHSEAIFVEINKWGTPGVQEYYDNRVESIYPSNRKVNEKSDDEVIDAFVGTKIISDPRSGYFQLSDQPMDENGPVDNGGPIDPFEQTVEQLRITKDC